MGRDSQAEESSARHSRWAIMGRRFRDQARVDLESAEESVRPRRYHNAVLFAEQAAEKGIKATYWHLLAEEPPWIHQFDRLATAVAAKSGGLPEEVEDALGQLATLSENCRYPSGDEEEPIPADLVSEADAKLAVEQAKRILAWVESLLRTPTGKPKHS